VWKLFSRREKFIFLKQIKIAIFPLFFREKGYDRNLNLCKMLNFVPEKIRSRLMNKIPNLELGNPRYFSKLFQTADLIKGMKKKKQQKKNKQTQEK
jgi:hypothetical protein